MLELTSGGSGVVGRRVHRCPVAALASSRETCRDNRAPLPSAEPPLRSNQFGELNRDASLGSAVIEIGV